MKTVLVLAGLTLLVSGCAEQNLTGRQMYDRAIQEFVRDDLSAYARWMQKSAESGFVPAMEMLAMAYLKGEGVPPDQALARRWMQSAADAGDQFAQYTLELWQENHWPATQPGVTELYAIPLRGKLLQFGRIPLDELFAIGHGGIPSWGEEQQKLLQPILAAVKSQPADTTIYVFSHRDSDPIKKLWGEQYSQRCADTIRNYFVQQGIAADRIEALGMDRHFPITPNRTREDKRTNRRIEIVLVAPESK